MKERAFRPGLDGDPERIGRRRREVGSSYVWDTLSWVLLSSIVGPIQQGAGDRPLYRDRGSKFEPGHRQIVRIKIKPSGKWETACYNRDERAFYLWIGGGWLDIGSDPVDCWTQMPPKPGGGMSADEYEAGRP